MSEPAGLEVPVPAILSAVAAVVGALWVALRAAVAKNEARLEAALAASEAERRRERDEARAVIDRLGAKLDAERESHYQDNARSARALLLARVPGSACEWESDAPTGVRDVLAVAGEPTPPRRGR